MRHEHFFTEVDRHENADRIRTRERCACGDERYGCYAKSSDVGGAAAWGRPRVWWFSQPMSNRASA